MKYEFSADLQPYPTKPNSTEAARISQSLKSVYVESIEEFMEDVQQGHT